MYQGYDQEHVDAVIPYIHRHMWYDSEELVVLALANKGSSDHIKSCMAARILASRRPRHFLPRQPIMKKKLLVGRAADVSQLYDFVGTDDLGCSFKSTTSIQHGLPYLLTSGPLMLDIRDSTKL